MVLPGYYRAQKTWDVVILRDDRLLAALELKSQSGSFGNNLNNRTEEVLGLSKDFWTAYREKRFSSAPQPWLGYFFLLEHTGRSIRPVKMKKSPFPADEAFMGASYLDRYRILCERLVLERDYTATAVIAAEKRTRGAKFTEPSESVSLSRFCTSLYKHLMVHG